MLLEIPVEIRTAMQQLDGAEPLRIVDPETKVTYVIIKAEVYDELQRVFSDQDPREAYPLISAMMNEDDEHDPLLDSYQSVTRDPQQQQR
jgi:hypothetical protein